MGKEKTQIIGIAIEDLKDLIQGVVRTEIEACLEDCRFGTEYKDEAWDRSTLANFLQITPEKVTDLFNRKELPGRKLGREYFFLKSQIIEVLKKKRV